MGVRVCVCGGGGGLEDTSDLTKGEREHEHFITNFQL